MNISKWSYLCLLITSLVLAAIALTYQSESVLADKSVNNPLEQSVVPTPTDTARPQVSEGTRTPTPIARTQVPTNTPTGTRPPIERTQVPTNTPVPTETRPPVTRTQVPTDAPVPTESKATPTRWPTPTPTPRQQSGPTATRAPEGRIQTTISEELLAEAKVHQSLELNPEASLQNKILVDRFVPNSPEFSVLHETTAYVAQRAENLSTGVVRVYFVPEGRWDEIRYVTNGIDSSTLAEALITNGQTHQTIQLNPNAALQKRIFQHSFVPTSAEFRLITGQFTYVAQRAEDLGSGVVRVYFVREGDWANVRYIVRP